MLEEDEEDEIACFFKLLLRNGFTLIDVDKSEFTFKAKPRESIDDIEVHANTYLPFISEYCNFLNLSHYYSTPNLYDFHFIFIVPKEKITPDIEYFILKFKFGGYE